MDSRTKLHVVYSNGVTEVNYSDVAQDFKRDSFTITPLSTDFLYIGFRKVINAIYFQLVAPNATQSSLSFEYYSTSGWKSLEISDDTRAFTRSGFINWTRPTDAAEMAVDDTPACWIRLYPNDDLDPVEFQAINLVFSDDNDIVSEVPALIDACFYQQSATSHILQHVAAKNYIMSRLRSVGYVKYTADGEQNINEWDVLDIFELRQASMYYAISQIYFNLSDSTEDPYWAKYKEYENKFEESFSLGRLRIDINDDGQEDGSEKRPIHSVRWVR